MPPVQMEGHLLPSRAPDKRSDHLESNRGASWNWAVSRATSIRKVVAVRQRLLNSAAIAGGVISARRFRAMGIAEYVATRRS